MTRSNTDLSKTRINYPEMGIEIACDYVYVINFLIDKVRNRSDATIVERVRAIDYLIGVGLKALEIGSLEERLTQMETAVENERPQLSGTQKRAAKMKTKNRKLEELQARKRPGAYVNVMQAREDFMLPILQDRCGSGYYERTDGMFKVVGLRPFVGRSRSSYIATG